MLQPWDRQLQLIYWLTYLLRIRNAYSRSSPLKGAYVSEGTGGLLAPEPPPLVDEVACFNTMLSVGCTPDAVIVFESARFGRNDTVLAGRCGVPFTRHCDVDVHFLMNRACAGRRRCSIAVSAATFGDPCGYDEFLRIKYRCVPGMFNACRVFIRSIRYENV